jgi:hypothetical protein
MECGVSKCGKGSISRPLFGFSSGCWFQKAEEEAKLFAFVPTLPTKDMGITVQGIDDVTAYTQHTNRFSECYNTYNTSMANNEDHDDEDIRALLNVVLVPKEEEDANSRNPPPWIGSSSYQHQHVSEPPASYSFSTKQPLWKIRMWRTMFLVTIAVFLVGMMASLLWYQQQESTASQQPSWYHAEPAAALYEYKPKPRVYHLRPEATSTNNNHEQQHPRVRFCCCCVMLNHRARPRPYYC